MGVPEMNTASERSDLSEIDEIVARRAVAGVDADILAAGGTADQADAVHTALRFYLLGDVAEARIALSKVFAEGMVESLLSEFKEGAAAAAPSGTPARAA